MVDELNGLQRTIWDECVKSVDFSHFSWKAWRTVNKIMGKKITHEKCPVSANSIASQLVKNGSFPKPDKEFIRKVSKDLTNKWKSITQSLDLMGDISNDELAHALKLLKPGKAPGPDHLHPEYLLQAGKRYIPG